ncbi:MAG: hypothetical protein FWC87_05245 [Acidimicrobiaceae bacterium]|nr:hypothetical protein [Acidimicrobiaceae bacterium]
MTLRVGFDVRALDDLRDAEGRYESNPNFLAEVWRAVDLVADWPKTAPLVADPGPDEIRRVAVGRFPYGIVYIVLDDCSGSSPWRTAAGVPDFGVTACRDPEMPNIPPNNSVASRPRLSLTVPPSNHGRGSDRQDATISDAPDGRR